MEPTLSWFAVSARLTDRRWSSGNKVGVTSDDKAAPEGAETAALDSTQLVARRSNVVLPATVKSPALLATEKLRKPPAVKNDGASASVPATPQAVADMQTEGAVTERLPPSRRPKPRSVVPNCSGVATVAFAWRVPTTMLPPRPATTTPSARRCAPPETSITEPMARTAAPSSTVSSAEPPLMYAGGSKNSPRSMDQRSFTQLPCKERLAVDPSRNRGASAMLELS